MVDKTLLDPTQCPPSKNRKKNKNKKREREGGGGKKTKQNAKKY